MRKKVHLLLFVLLISSNLSVGKSNNKTKTIKGYKKAQVYSKNKPNIERIKRSIDDEDDRPFWANRGKKQSEDIYGMVPKFLNNNRILKTSDKEPPFWGNRGRRDSEENHIDDPIVSDSYLPKHYSKPAFTYPKNVYDSKERREEIAPFWGNRGRRTSDELIDDGDSPFWGNRGRREEDEPFWGNRGRREEEPFWGNRGRRENALPFWDNRGRRTQYGKWVEDSEPFWGNRGRRKDQQTSVIDVFSGLEEEIENLRLQSEYEKSAAPQHSFWLSKGRDSSIKHLFSAKPRYKYEFVHPTKKDADGTSSDAGAMQEDGIFVDEPHYIVVERSSRSSGEFMDPFFISRGKKKNRDLEAARGRRARGAIQDIVKSVKDDPYFIVRGKKDYGENDTKVDNSSANHRISKAAELICATIGVLLRKTEGSKLKREAIESDRGRRAILKKLAEMAQMDPYFVSRGKKSGDRMYPNLTPNEFINHVSDMCN